MALKMNANGSFYRPLQPGESRLTNCFKFWDPQPGQIVKRPHQSQCDDSIEAGVVVSYTRHKIPETTPEDIEVVAVFESGSIEHFNLEDFLSQMTPTRVEVVKLRDDRYVDDTQTHDDYHDGQFDLAFAWPGAAYDEPRD